MRTKIFYDTARISKTLKSNPKAVFGALKKLIHTRVDYLDIVPEKSIMSVERVKKGKNVLAIALIKMNFHKMGRGTRLSMTIHLTSYKTPDMIQSYKMDWKSSLSNLKI